MHKMYKYIRENRPFFVFIFVYILFRILLINVNFTEWGDTFRMIRGAEYLSRGLWPFDEKRLPFYSLLLVPGVWFNSQIFWGRLLSIISSTVNLFFVYIFYLRFISSNKKFALFSSVLLSVTSVFAYWSLRVMADPIFSTLTMVFIYFVMKFYYKDKKDIGIKKLALLSVLLIAITMTRLEGAFLALSVGLFFLIKKKWLDSIIVFLPQIFIYLPWIFYTKFIYSGDVQNNYFDELQGFVFDLKRFEYFFSYTIYVLVIPCLIVFFAFGILLWKKNKIFNSILWLPLGMFLILELIVGFIWTPSLPRIYMPIIPFLVMLSVFGIEKINHTEHKVLFVSSNLFALGLFVYLQSTQKLYFLGASKLLFLILIVSSVLISVSIFFRKSFEKVIFTSLISLSVIVSFIVVYNQKDIYKTVKQGINYTLENPGFVAYSDETGNTEYYLKDRSVYLPPNLIMNPETQYKILRNWNTEYLLWTNEFNRGSSFIDPKNDPRYRLLAVYQKEIKDPFDVLLNKLDIEKDDNNEVFYTKVYLVK